MTTLIFFLIFGIILIAVGFAVMIVSGGIRDNDKESLIQYYSSLLSDMNVDYRDTKIGAENILHISESMRNLTKQIEKMAPNIEKTDEATQKWFLGIIDEFHSALALWTERHGDEIIEYESSLENQNSPPIALLEKRLQIQSENMRKIIV